jgi:dihydrofolate reductase
VTRTDGWNAGSSEVLVARGVSEAIDVAAAIDDEVFVVGGAAVYADALPLADRLVLTHVDAEPEGDTRFPELDPREWRELLSEDGDGVAYVTYVRAEASAGDRQA